MAAYYAMLRLALSCHPSAHQGWLSLNCPSCLLGIGTLSYRLLDRDIQSIPACRRKPSEILQEFFRRSPRFSPWQGLHLAHD
jgi:hypothetical protein